MTQITIIATPGGDSQHDEKYDLKEGTVTMSGTQVLARLPLEQRSRDQHAGLNTGGFISGIADPHWAGTIKNFGEWARDF